MSGIFLLQCRVSGDDDIMLLKAHICQMHLFVSDLNKLAITPINKYEELALFDPVFNIKSPLKSDLIWSYDEV